MQGNEYQTLAWETAKPFYKQDGINSAFEQLQVTTMMLGLVAKTGDLTEEAKRQIVSGTGLDYNKLEIQLGDVLWYVASLAKLMGFKLEDVMGHNIAQLRETHQLQHKQMVGSKQ